MVADATVYALNTHGDSLGFFVAELALHFTIVGLMVAQIRLAWPKVPSRFLQITYGISVVKFASIFFFFAPHNCFYMNFIFYSTVMQLALKCLN